MPEPENKKRVKDEHHDHDNAHWGFSDQMGHFVEELQDKFPEIRITSGVRESSKGHHHTGDAVDIGVKRSTDKQALLMYDWLVNDKQGLELMSRYGLGIIDETDPDMMKKTGATGPHFHIGKDSKFAKQTNDRLNSFNSYYTYPDRPEAKYKKSGDSWLINLGDKTGNKYVKLEDPEGKRAQLLNQSAKVVNVGPEKITSYYSKNLIQSQGHDSHEVRESKSKASKPSSLENPPSGDQIVALDPVFNFIKDSNEELKKSEIRKDREIKSDYRRKLNQIEQNKVDSRNKLLKLISNNRPYQSQKSNTSTNRTFRPSPNPSIDIQTKLPSLPSLSEMPEFSQDNYPNFK